VVVSTCHPSYVGGVNRRILAGWPWAKGKILLEKKKERKGWEHDSKDSMPALSSNPSTDTHTHTKKTSYVN
jgi:hypothetical protein